MRYAKPQMDTLTALCLALVVPFVLGSELPEDENKGVGHCRCAFDSFELSDNRGKECKTVRMKLLYPDSNSNSGDVNPLPRPVVLFFGGALMESNRYQWLGEKLVRECDIVFVTTETIGLHHGLPMMLPLEGGRRKPKTQNPGLSRLFDKLKEVNSAGLLAGRLDLNRVVVGGHSWGGRIALVEAANDKFFPNVVGAFIYAAHALILPKPGFIPGSAMSLDGHVPTLLMIGSKDGRIKMTGYQFWTVFRSPAQPVLRTFRRSFAPGRSCYYVELKGFNHMSPVYPEDGAIPSQMYDGWSPHSKETMKDELFRIISLFVKEHAYNDASAAQQLRTSLFSGRNPYVKSAKWKKRSDDDCNTKTCKRSTIV